MFCQQNKQSVGLPIILLILSDSYSKYRDTKSKLGVGAVVVFVVLLQN